MRVRLATQLVLEAGGRNAYKVSEAPVSQGFSILALGHHTWSLLYSGRQISALSIQSLVLGVIDCNDTYRCYVNLFK